MQVVGEKKCGHRKTWSCFETVSRSKSQVIPRDQIPHSSPLSGREITQKEEQKGNMTGFYSCTYDIRSDFGEIDFNPFTHRSGSHHTGVR